jgi:hypothetical protein
MIPESLGPLWKQGRLLFPHFSETRAAIFAVEQVEDGGH